MSAIPPMPISGRESGGPVSLEPNGNDAWVAANASGEVSVRQGGRCTMAPADAVAHLLQMETLAELLGTPKYYETV